jgi:hypothetical protein
MEGPCFYPQNGYVVVGCEQRVGGSHENMRSPRDALCARVYVGSAAPLLPGTLQSPLSLWRHRCRPLAGLLA